MSSWKKEAAKEASNITQQQFTYQQKLIDQRESERTAAMGQMDSLLNNAPSYQIPAQVQQYTDLMNVLGGQLYGIQDASGGAKSIDTEQYRSQTEQVGQWSSKAGAYNPVVSSEGSTTTGRRQPGDIPPTSQSRPSSEESNARSKTGAVNSKGGRR